MGNAVYRIFEKLSSCGPKEVRILMIGLDAAGKTTILYRLKLGEYIKTVPTIGFNVEKVEYKSISFIVWDVGGQERIRHLWRQYLLDAKGLIFVLDSNDRERVDQAKQELAKVIEDPELAHDIKVLVLANKHDLPDAMAIKEVKDKLGITYIHKYIKRSYCHFQQCSAKTGEGLFEGFDWLASAIK